MIGSQHQRPIATTLQRRPARDASVPRKHKVKKGETLTQIAAEFGVSVDELKKANSTKLKSWPAKNAHGTKTPPHFVWGFNAGEEISIPPTQASPSGTPQEAGTGTSLRETSPENQPGEVKEKGGGEENVSSKTISLKPQPTKLSEEAIKRWLDTSRQLTLAMQGLVLGPENKKIESKKPTTEVAIGSQFQTEQWKNSAIIFFSVSIPLTEWQLKKPPFHGQLKFFDKLEVQISGGLKRGDINPRWLYPVAGEAALNMIHFEREFLEKRLKLEFSALGKISGEYVKQTKEESAQFGGAVAGGIQFKPGEDSPWSFNVQGTGELNPKTIDWKNVTAKPVWGFSVGIKRKF